MLQNTERKRPHALLKRVSILLAVPIVLTMLIGVASAASPSHKQKNLQKTFANPEQAAQDLATAARTNNTDQLMSILGVEGKGIIFSGDEVEDHAVLARFAGAYDEKHELVKMNEDKAVLEVGKDGWPLPIPIVNSAGKWRFDTAAGKDEILNRRIGRNELSTIQSCLAYVDAQREYASKDRNGDGTPEYAQQISSDPGKKNGLYWEAGEGEEQSPLGPLFASAKSEGYRKKSTETAIPYHGYYFKILKAQGKSAPRGAFNYVTDGRMVGGFALVAYPAAYGTSGIMTFIVNQDGVIYENNLGKKTGVVAKAMTQFNPDESWRKVGARDLELMAK